MNPTTPNRPAYSYLRFSTPEQEKGDSQRRQTEGTVRICREKGWVLQTKTYRDCGVSAFRGRNRTKGDLSAFLAALEARQLEPNPVLILEDLDRLSRDKIMASVDVARKILEQGCDLFSVIEYRLYTKDSLNDPMGLMGLIWRFYLAHEESQKKAVRSRENWTEKHRQAAEGKVFSKICPGWLKVVDQKKKNNRVTGGRFEEIPERVELVRKLFRWCIEGHGLQSIMRRLLEEKVPPFRSGWAQKYIWDILRDRRVLGELPTQIHGEKVKPGPAIPGYYPPIIDEKTYRAAQDAMKLRSGKQGRKGDFVNLFTGLVRYPEHDCNMVFISKPKTNKSGKHNYRYLVSYLGWKKEHPYVAVRYERFESVVLHWLYELKASDLLPQENQEDGIETLKAQRKFLEERIKNIADQLDQLGAEVPAVMAKLAEMQVEKTRLTNEIEEKSRQQTRPNIEDTKALVDLMKSKSGSELKELREQVRQRLLMHLEKIEVSVEDKRVFLTIRLHSGTVRKVWYDTAKDEQGVWGTEVPLTDMAHMAKSAKKKK